MLGDPGERPIMIGLWCQRIAVGLAVAVIAVEIAGSTVGRGVLIGSLMTPLGIGVGIWDLLYLLRDLGPQICGAIATMGALTKRLRSEERRGGEKGKTTGSADH